MKDKTKIYILHGWTYSTEKWQPFVSTLKEHGIDTKIVKIPGLTAPLDRVWDLEDYITWLKKSLDNDLPAPSGLSSGSKTGRQEKKVILLGHSNGGRIILNFAAKYPEIVRQLILIDSAGIYHNELPIRIKRSVFGTAAKVGKFLTKSEKLRLLLYRFAREKDYYQANPILRKTMNNLHKVDLVSLLKHITVPTLIIWGALDNATPVSDGKMMHERIKNSKLYIISGAKHSPQFTHEKEVTDIITREIFS